MQNEENKENVVIINALFVIYNFQITAQKNYVVNNVGKFILIENMINI